MNRNGKEFLLNFAKLWSATRPRVAFGSNAAMGEKRCEAAPPSEGTSCESVCRWYEFASFVGNKILSIHEAQAVRLHALVQDAEPCAV
jgi:hypothetical protein